eukprot:PITA_13645
MALVGECVETEPSSFEEAVQQPIWVDAMVEEYDSIVHNSVWDVIPRPKDKSIVSSRWLYKVKKVADGSVEKLEARFVSHGFSQVEGIEYDVNFFSYSKVLIYQINVGTISSDGLDDPLDGCEDYVPQCEHTTRFVLCDEPVELSYGSTYQVVLEAKHVLRYLKGTSQYGLWYRWTEGVKLQDFTDADWVGSPSDRKITSGRIFNLGLAAVSWYSKKQRSVALSLAKAKYMASSQAACEAIWMRKILIGLFGQRMDPTVIYCDN